MSSGWKTISGGVGECDREINIATGEFKESNPALRKKSSTALTVETRRRSSFGHLMSFHPPLSPLLASKGVRAIESGARRTSLTIEQVLTGSRRRTSENIAHGFTMEDLLEIKRKLDAAKLIQCTYRDFRSGKLRRRRQRSLRWLAEKSRRASRSHPPGPIHHHFSGNEVYPAPQSKSRGEPSPISSALNADLFMLEGSLDEY